MNQLGQILEFLQKLIVWWVTIMPWEQAVHIRMGNRVKVIGAGLHVRIPFIDRVYVQTTRVRVMQGPPQTVSTKDGKTVTIATNIGYAIEDILKLYQTLYHAEMTLSNIMQGIMSDEVFSRNIADCTPSILEAVLREKLTGSQFGLRFDYMKITSFAVVRTYRLIQDSHWTPNALETDKQKA